jgi:hypothetical protein
LKNCWEWLQSIINNQKKVVLKIDLKMKTIIAFPKHICLSCLLDFVEELLISQLPCSKQKWLHCPKMSLIVNSLYQSSFIPSVINLWNSLDNDTRNTRTSDSFKINLKSKVVLAKIPTHFLVGDRQHNILYARLCRSCKLAQVWSISIQYNNRFEMCLWIYHGGRFPLSLELSLVYRTEDSSF